MLGLHPGAEFSPAAAAALLDQPEPVAEETLLALTRANLLMPAKSGRHRFHALLRQHARAKALEEDPAAHREDALRRIVRHYHDFVMARDVVLSKRRRLSDRYADVVPAHRGEDAHARALADLDAERATLTEVVRVAAEAGMHDRVWQLCESLFPYHVDRDHYEDVLAVQPLGVAAAERAGDDRALVRMHSQHGSAYFIAHEYDTAQEHFERSAALADRIGDALGRQSAVEWSGLIHERRGEFDAALECFEKSREIVETRFEPDRRERPRGLYRMHSGRVLTAAGRGDEAIPRLREAFDFFVGLGERANPAKIALSLAQAHLQVGDVPEAAGWAQRALGLCREVRSAADTAAVLEVLAEIATRQGDADGAARHRREAGEILALLGDDRARALLGRRADS
ncbi:hypothetical protein GCM10025787_18520 [Saccharopolyspora rosea]|uniref:Tetratricopeptide repeat protein n=1 Tax=Saccharopolyspora rosea TaxID=524884 RepID=A0ABW3G0M3_9PSEU